MFPWYQSTINQIMGGVSYERQSWYIDLYNNPLLADIDYTIISTQKGGKKITMKKRKNTLSYVMNDISYDPMSYDEIYNLKYKLDDYKFKS